MFHLLKFNEEKSVFNFLEIIPRGKNLSFGERKLERRLGKDGNIECGNIKKPDFIGYMRT